MADVEMDLDPSRSLVHDDHVDEDLIEYDLDTDAMQDNNIEWPAGDLEIQDVNDDLTEANMDTHITMEPLVNDEGEQAAEAMDTHEVHSTTGIPNHDADMLSELGADDQETEDRNQETEHLEPESTAAELLGAAQQEATEGDADHDQLHIDISADVDESTTDPKYEDEALPEGDLDAGVDQDTAVATASQEVGPDDDASKPVDGLLNAEDEPTTKNTAATDEEELTWEEDEEPASIPQTAQGDEIINTEEAENSHGATGQAVADDAPDGQALTVDAVDLAQDGSEPTGAGYEEETEHQAALPEEQAETNIGQAGATDTSYEQEEVADGGLQEVQYPSITVQYKGEEFPCFAASDGFFTQVSLLNESMENILAGFRAELATELASDEELIFHIDELGLEFAESSQHDLLAGTTLHYLMEIYDMLVQNQDQDHEAGSKPMYTYLFTRSSTSKRLEYLTESAANGRGLDEVIHLFEPAMSHPATVASGEDTPDLFEDQHDDYPSPGDELVQIDQQEETEGQSGQQNDQAVFAADQPLITHDETATGVEGIVHDTDLDEITYEDDEDEGDDAKELAHTTGETAAAPADDDAPSIAEPSTTDAQTPNLAEHELDVELQSNAEFDAVDFGPEEVEVDEGATQGLDAPTSTSASSTLDGTERPSLAVVDEAIETNDTEPTTQPEPEPEAEGDDEFAEIDWRDNGDEEETHQDETNPDEQMTPAKRARADDELDVDEESDAKRHRSS